MASPVLHIKDAYFFEVPKFLWPSHRQTMASSGRLDPSRSDFQMWKPSSCRRASRSRFRDTFLGRVEQEVRRLEGGTRKLRQTALRMLEEAYTASQQEYAAWKKVDKARADTQFTAWFHKNHASTNSAGSSGNSPIRTSASRGGR